MLTNITTFLVSFIVHYNPSLSLDLHLPLKLECVIFYKIERYWLPLNPIIILPWFPPLQPGPSLTSQQHNSWQPLWIWKWHRLRRVRGKCWRGYWWHHQRVEYLWQCKHRAQWIYMFMQPWCIRERGGGIGNGEGEIMTNTMKWLWDSAYWSTWNQSVELPRHLLISSEKNCSTSAYWETT